MATITGNEFDDTLSGTSADDSISGNAGKDTIVLGDDYGADTVSGGEVGEGAPDGYQQIQSVIISDQLNDTKYTEYSFGNGALDYMTSNVYAELTTPSEFGSDALGDLEIGNEVYVNGVAYTVTAQTGGYATISYDDGAGTVHTTDDSISISNFTLSNGTDTIYAQVIGNPSTDLPDGAEILGYNYDIFSVESGASLAIGYNDSGTDSFTASVINEDVLGEGCDHLDASGEDADQTLLYTADETGTLTNGTDTVTFTGIEEVSTGAGDDTIDASETTVGVVIDAGAGDDSVIGGSGDDTITGGTGNDSFELSGGCDTITDFGTGNTGAVDDGDQSNNDFVDLSGHFNASTLDAVNSSDADSSNNFEDALDMLRADAEDGTIDGTIYGTDYSGQIGDVDLKLESGGVAVTGSDLTYDNTNVPCFVQGTMIDTLYGPTPIENLKTGDLVQTRDNGFQQISWIGSSIVNGRDDLAPIRFEAGMLDNDRPLLVSPNHCVLIRGRDVQLNFGQREVFVSAKSLLRRDGVKAVKTPAVHYYHLMFTQHEVVRSNGVWSESFFPGSVAMTSLNRATQAEIFRLFPELQAGDVSQAYGQTARLTLKPFEAALLD